MRALFWNLGGALESTKVVDIALTAFSPDILCLAEGARYGGRPPLRFVEVALPRCRLTLFLDRSLSVTLHHSEPNWALVEISGTLVAVCHLRSSTGEGRVIRREELRSLGTELRRLRPAGDRTVVLGDLNLEPFDKDLTHYRHLRARQTRLDAQADAPALLSLGIDHIGRRTFRGRDYCGTYLFRVASKAFWKWATLDHALASPDLDAKMRIVDRVPKLTLDSGLGSRKVDRKLPDHRAIIVEW